MINENINVDIKLSGQYRISIIDDSGIIFTSDWRSNTILSSGLVDLYTYDIPTVCSYLDLGLSNNLPGLSGYSLSGVIIPSEFVNIYKDITEIYQDDVASKIYYTTFTTAKATSAATINEFSIKRSLSSAFARNTFSTGYDVEVGQYVNFEYKLILNWESTTTSVVSMTGNDSNYNYTIPCVTKSYNIPYDRVFYNNNYLALLGNIRDLDIDGNYTTTDRLPDMGEDFPIYYDWGIQGELTSVYAPTILSAGIDNPNRRFNVSTKYSNIKCFTNSGLYNNVKNALLVVDGNFTKSSNKFNITQFEYPLTIYNDAYNYTGGVLLVNDTYKYNTLSLTYNYSWYECSVCEWTLCVDNTNLVLDNSWNIYINDNYIGVYSGDVYENICLTIDKSFLIIGGTNQLRFNRANCVSDDYFVFTLTDTRCNVAYSNILSQSYCTDPYALPERIFTFSLSAY